MKCLRLLLAVPLLVVLSSSIAQAQFPPVCGNDPTCTPDTSSSTYPGAATARVKMLNARGNSSPIVPRYQSNTTTPPHTPPQPVTLIGSQSFNYTVPILRMPGRAGMDLILNLYYNSRIWDVDTVDGTVTFNADRDYPSYGFRLDFGYIENTLNNLFILTQPDGTKVALTGPNAANSFDSTDGTYIDFNDQTNVLTYKNGKTVQYSAFPSNGNLLRPTQVKDANGNYFSISYMSGQDQLVSSVSDSLGRVIDFNYMQDGSNRLQSLTQQVQVSTVDPSGVHTYATLNWGQLYGNSYVWYNFSSLAVNGAPAFGTALNVLTGCTYANGTGYRFKYGDWGIINEIDTLSSNGTIRSYVQYNYPAASAGGLTDAPAYTQQTVSPDGTSNTSVWGFQTGKDGTGVVTSMAVTDPNGNVNTTNLDPNTGLTSSTTLQNSSGSTLQTVSYTWTTSEGGTVPSVIQTTNDAGQVSSVQYSYDLNSVLSYGQPAVIEETDFDGTVKRTTAIQYDTATHAAAPYVSRHILGLPFQIVVATGINGSSSLTRLAYDGGSLTSVTGAPNHDDVNYGSGFLTRGNLTSVTRFASVTGPNGGVWTTNGAVQTLSTYDSLGNVLTTQPDCCSLETLNFSSTTQYSSPDSIVRGPSGGPQFTVSYLYNHDKSLVVQETDENAQVTQYQYDTMNRMTQMILPPQNGTHVQQNVAYGDSAAAPTVTNSATADNSGTVTLPVVVTTLDGLGHVKEVDTEKSDGTLVSSVTYGYDKAWQKIQQSNPFAPGDTVVYTTFAYDGLGRVTSVTPPSAGSAQYQYSGNLVTFTDPGGKLRKTYTDSLGRLTEVDEPGENYPGIQAQGTIDIGQIKGIATPSHGSVTIATSTNGEQCSQGFCQTGSVSVSFNNGAETDTASFGSGDTTTSVAQKLASAINNCGHSPCYATATSSGATVNFTSTGKGSADNWPVSASYSEAGTTIWSTGTTQSPNSTTGNRGCIGSSLTAIAELYPNQCLSSPSGRFVLSMLTNGNLVLYDTTSGSPGTQLWIATNSPNFNGYYAQLGSNGVLTLNFTCCGGRTRAAWSSGAANPTAPYYLTVQNDGNVVIYKGFATPSFTISPTQQTMTGGTDAGLVDHGTVTMAVGSFTTPSVPYGPGTSNTNGSQVASALASALSVNGSGLTATTNSATAITITETVPGAAGNGVSVSVSPTSGDPADFPVPSFSVSPINLSGGVNPYSPGFAHAYVTTYTYDGMNDITGVSQAAGNVNDQPVPGQPRSYVYDSMGRLISSSTPEAGTVTYSYTTSSGGNCASNPNLACSSGDARGVTKTFTYDGINRLTGVSYSDGVTPSVSYSYDAGGAGAYALTRLTKTTDGSNSQTLTYDNLGRVQSANQVIDGNPYLTQYGYNLAGQITGITYPSGRTVTQGVDSIGRMSSISDSSATYMSNVSYNAAGAPLGVTLGNTVQGVFTYNDHLQIATLRYVKTGASTDALNLSYDYTTGVPGNNGQIQALHYYTSPGVEDTTKSELFTYDPVGRLSAAQTITVNSTPGTWSLIWAYDRLGNRLSQALVGGNVSIGQPNLTFDSTTNHISNGGFTYDAAGNMTKDGMNTYAYDGANRQTQINSGAATYTYFGPLRIKKAAGSTTTVYIYSGKEPIAEYVNGSLSTEYIYSGARLLATVAGGAVTYHHPDRLSNRSETDSSGNVARTYGHFPYGETWYETGTADKWKFAGYERDAQSGETGLDYAQARYYASGFGRFMSTDPVGGMISIPQSTNRYGYVGGDPVNRTDPQGLLWGAEALCMLDADGNFTNICAKLGMGPADGSDNELFGTGLGVGSIACSGGVFGGPTSFCSSVPGCPIFELFMCSGFGTASSILGPTLTGPPTFTLGPTFLGAPPPLSPFTDPNHPDPMGMGKACSLVTLVESGCYVTTVYDADAYLDAVLQGVIPPSLGSYGSDANGDPMGRSTYNPPPIPPRGPFVPPPAITPPPARLP